MYMLIDKNFAIMSTWVMSVLIVYCNKNGNVMYQCYVMIYVTITVSQ